MARWRWLIYDFIPPAIDVDTGTRRKIRGHVRRSPLFRQKGLWPRVAVVLAGMAAVWWGMKWIESLVPSSAGDDLTAIAVILAGFVLGLCLYAPLRARITYQQLRRHGYEVCGRCGYWLRDLPGHTERCPECGHEREVMPETGGPPEPAPADPRPSKLPRGGFDQWS